MIKDIRYYERNENGRDFVVGDLHGCYDEFISELDKIEFDKSKDRMFSVGDLTDRGPKSTECLNLLFEPWFHPIKGNHELLWYFAHTRGTANDIGIFIHNGGEMLEEYEQYAAEIKNLPFIIEIESKSGKKIGLVHAQVPPGICDWNQLKKVFLESIDAGRESMLGYGLIYEAIWGRDRINKYQRQKEKKRIYPEIENIDEVYVGHTIVENPTKIGKVNFIDGGAFVPYWISETRRRKMAKSGKMLNPRLIIKELK